MQYQTVKSLLENTPYQSSKFRTKNVININGDSRETINSQIKFKTMMLKSSLCDYSNT